MENTTLNALMATVPIVQTKTVRWILYARKSTEQDEKQALSIESQVKEMLQIAEREKLEIVEIKRESHSAKASGQRPVFKEIVEGIAQDKYTGILTWAPDRLSRNAGDIGSLIDLMDQQHLAQIQTFGQRFTNSPADKFLLMILCGQAKLENDNKSLNVKRGLRARVEMGHWPCVPPTGYLKSSLVDKKCQVTIDPERAPIIKKIFEKVAYEKWSGRKAYLWLTNEVNFRTKYDKHLSIGNLFRVLENHFYYGYFEFPKKSGKWYKGLHEPIITKELFDLARANIKSQIIKSEGKEFAFTKLITCGLCGSGVTADEKFKKLKGGGVNRHVYYGCCKSKDRDCKGGYINEEDLIKQFESLIDKIDVDEIGIKEKIKVEIQHIKKFMNGMLGQRDKIEVEKIDIRNYAKYVLREGSSLEKRELLGCLKSKIKLTNKIIETV